MMWPPKLIQVVVCANDECNQPAVAIVADKTALCADHALQWYMRERVTS